MASARINKEWRMLLDNPLMGITFNMIDNNPRYARVIICGPKGSPYEDGKFELEMFLPDGYPMSPPMVRFLTKVYHPNIDKVGRICLSILKEGSTTGESATWSPALQMRTVGLSIQNLLDSPNVDDPLDNNVAEHWKRDEAGAIRTAHEWTCKYATKL